MSRGGGFDVTNAVVTEGISDFLMRERMTQNFSQAIRFFGRFTWNDLVRLSFPTALLFATANFTQLELSVKLVGLATTGLTGVIWYVWKPYGKPVDVHLYHLARWMLRREV